MFSFPKSFFTALALTTAAVSAFDDEGARFLQGKKGADGDDGGKKGGIVLPVEPVEPAPFCPVVPEVVPETTGKKSGGKKSGDMSMPDDAEPTCVVGVDGDDGLTFDQMLSAPGVIFGSGNLNGGYTISSANGVEVALRGKLRYNAACQPEDTYNIVGNAGYNFPAGPCLGGSQPTRPTWSFEYAVNSDIGCDSVPEGADCITLNTYDYHIQIDSDPSYCTEFDWVNQAMFSGTFDPVNDFTDTFKPSNGLGSANSKQGGGGQPQCSDGTNDWTCGSPSRCNFATDAFNNPGCLGGSTINYETAIQEFTVAQNSQLYTFLGGGPPGFDINRPGIYTIKLTAKCQVSGLVIAATSIDIIVGNLITDFPTTDVNCEGGNFGFNGLFASEEECKDFVLRYASP